MLHIQPLYTECVIIDCHVKSNYPVNTFARSFRMIMHSRQFRVIRGMTLPNYWATFHVELTMEIA